MLWALLADSVALYPLYALLFADAGLSDAAISALFAIWSLTAVVAEVPSGVLADRWSRRGCLVAAGIGQAIAFAVWIAVPSFAGFAAGFVLWGLSGCLASGATEALVYDALAGLGAADEFPRVYGRMAAASLVAQVPAAAQAAVLFPLGGYPLVGAASVITLIAAAAVAATLPEPPRTRTGGLTALAHLRIPAARSALVCLAAVSGIDAVEEYFPLLARAWGLPTGTVPLALLVIPVLGAAGAGAAGRLRTTNLVPALLAAATLFAGAAVSHDLVVLAAGYGLYRAALVLAQVRLQQAIGSEARATVTSFAAVAEEVTVFAVYGAWAGGGLPAVAAVVVVTAGLCLRG